MAHLKPGEEYTIKLPRPGGTSSARDSSPKEILIPQSLMKKRERLEQILFPLNPA